MEVDEDEDAASRSDKDVEAAIPAPTQGQRVYSQHKVRTSNKDRSLESMLAAPSASSSSAPSAHAIPEASTSLVSVLNLRQAVKDSAHNSMLCPHRLDESVIDIADDRTEGDLQGPHVRRIGGRAARIVTRATRHTALFAQSRCNQVPAACKPRTLSLTPHVISEELFYQLGLRQFSAYPRVALNPPPSLRKLVRIGLEAELKRRPAPKQRIDVRPAASAPVSRSPRADPRTACRIWKTRS